MLPGSLFNYIFLLLRLYRFAGKLNTNRIINVSLIIREIEEKEGGDKCWVSQRSVFNCKYNTFSAEKKAPPDAADPKAQEWENLAWKFQEPLPWAKEGEKWITMDKIFQLS